MPLRKATLQVSDLVPPNPFRPGDPPGRNATLMVRDVGPDPDRVLPMLQAIADLPNRSMARFEGAMPVTITLPKAYYDESDGELTALRNAGCAFSVTSYSWVCPKEEADDHHWCSSTCSSVQIAEVLS